MKVPTRSAFVFTTTFGYSPSTFWWAWIVHSRIPGLECLMAFSSMDKKLCGAATALRILVRRNGRMAFWPGDELSPEKSGKAGALGLLCFLSFVDLGAMRTAGQSCSTGIHVLAGCTATFSAFQYMDTNTYQQTQRSQQKSAFLHKSHARWTFSRGYEVCAVIFSDCDLWKSRKRDMKKYFLSSGQKSKDKDQFYNNSLWADVVSI